MTRFVLILMASFLMQGTAFAAIDENIKVVIEEPINNEAHGGSVSNIRGWAVARDGIDHVDLYIDGEFRLQLPFGARRRDVGSQYPDYKNSDESGYSMAFNYTLLGSGAHDFKVIAYDANGNHNERISSITISRFEPNFIADPEGVNLTTAVGYLEDGQNLVLANLTAEGAKYGVQLAWRKPSQDIDIVYKTKSSYASALQDGQWLGQAQPNQAFVNNAPCLMRTVDFNISDGSISGNAVDTSYTAYRISGKVGQDGIIRDGTFTELGGNAGGSLYGSLADGIAGGGWKAPSGCAGSWIVLLQQD